MIWDTYNKHSADYWFVYMFHFKIYNLNHLILSFPYYINHPNLTYIFPYHLTFIILYILKYLDLTYIIPYHQPLFSIIPNRSYPNRYHSFSHNYLSLLILSNLYTFVQYDLRSHISIHRSLEFSFRIYEIIS